MKFFRILQVLFVIFFIQSCSGGLKTTELSQEGESAYQAGKYEAALISWEQIIEGRENKGKKAEGDVYVGAGKSALMLNQTDKARKYLETAKDIGFSSPEMYSSLAKVYKIIDNLSKEISALEIYCKKYPQGNEINPIKHRLFETYIESENWDLAIKLWLEIEAQVQENTKMLAAYLILNKNLKNTAICDKTAQQILKLESNNLTALEWYAEKYYWIAENLYLKEMKAYKENRSNSQYKKLLKALDEVWPNFQKSRDYYLKLYKIDTKPEYAKYLANIYTRYDNKDKAAYYNKRSK